MALTDSLPVLLKLPASCVSKCILAYGRLGFLNSRVFCFVPISFSICTMIFVPPNSIKAACIESQSSEIQSV